MYLAKVTAMRQAAMHPFPFEPDKATARRRAFRVIKGGQQVVLEGVEGARYWHCQEP